MAFHFDFTGIPNHRNVTIVWHEHPDEYRGPAHAHSDVLEGIADGSVEVVERFTDSDQPKVVQLACGTQLYPLWKPATRRILDYFMFEVVGLPALTSANASKAFARIRTWETLNGSRATTTADEVNAHVGLKTNASRRTDTQWRKHTFQLAESNFARGFDAFVREEARRAD